MGYLLLVLAAVCIIYRPWFSLTGTLSSGDWPYLFLQNIQEFKIPTELPFLWLDPYYQITAKIGVQVFSLPWETIERIFWFWPFIALSLVSSYVFLKYMTSCLEIGKKSSIFIAVGILIFTTNTYILMLTGGGQMGVVMAYSLVPLVLQRIFLIFDNSKFGKKEFILSALILGIQLMFDPRIFLLTMLTCFIYVLFRFKDIKLKTFKKIFVTLVFSVGINLFWILPNVSHFNAEYRAATEAVDARFLSFATFSNSFSLLQPNWPENIFGKVGFMKSEFILLPIIAFAALFFARKNKVILFFALLGIIGAFMSKGTNPPFGEIYQGLSAIPGFSAFRDPTKFYILTVVSYVVLIPYVVTKFNKKISIILSLGFLVYWLILIRPALSGQLTGTFSPHLVSQDYLNYKNFIVNQSGPVKTLWVPTIERFGFNSKISPAISASEKLRTSSVSGILSKLNSDSVRQQLIKNKIKYVVIPDDILGEIFLTDRKYDNKLYLKTINNLRNIVWLSEVKKNNFGRIKVFEIVNN